MSFMVDKCHFLFVERFISMQFPRARAIIFISSSRTHSLDKFEQIGLADSSILDSQPHKEGKFENS